MARLRGIPPSELLGVGCEWCAYCLDEALLVREATRARRQADELSAVAEDDQQVPGRVKF